MLKEIAILLCSTVAISGVMPVQAAAPCVEATAPITAESFMNQPLEAKFTPSTGLSIASPLADLSFFSSVMAIEPPWRTVRFYSVSHSKTERIDGEDGSYTVKMLQTNDTNEVRLNEYSCKIVGSTATITLDCEAIADIPNVFEYSAFAIPEATLINATYSIELADGTVLENQPISEDIESKVVSIADGVKKLTFHAQLGDITIEVKEGAPFNLTDRRGIVFSNKKCFWMGYQTELNYGSPFKSVIELSFDLKETVSIAVPLSVSTEVAKTKEVKDGIVKFTPEPTLLPAPQDVTFNKGSYKVKHDNVSIALHGGFDAGTARFEKAIERIFGKLELTADVADCCNKNSGISITIDPELSENSEYYTLDVTPKSITIEGASERAAFYALQTLSKLYSDGEFKAVSIVDYPDMEFRAAHLIVDNYSHIFHTNLVKDVLAPMNYNAVVLECEYVKWDTTEQYGMHQPWGMTKADYIELVNFCNDNYIDVVPLFQTLGHCGWMFEGPNDTYINLHWAEDPSYPYAYNVSAPGLYEFVEAALDEVLEASNYPKYLHIGHDEVFHPKAEYPHRPENKEIGIQKLLYNDLMWFYEYAQKRDLEIMLWHDLFVTQEESPENGAGGAPHFIADIRDDLPRDLVFVAWRYDGRNVDFPDITALYNEGFPLVGATWNDMNNIKNLTTFCNNLDALGMIQTIWCGYNGNRSVHHYGFSQLPPYVGTGVWSWNPNADQNNFSASKLYNDLIVSWTEPKETGSVTLVDIAPYTNLKLDEASNPFLANTTYGMDKLDTGKVQVGRVKFDLPSRNGVPSVVALKSRLNPMFPEEVDIPVDLDCKELFLFMAAVNVAPSKFTDIATLVVEYENGETFTQPIQYNWQISAIDDSFNYYQNTASVRSWEYEGKDYNNWFFNVKLPENKSSKIKNLKLQANSDGWSFYLLGLSAK